MRTYRNMIIMAAVLSVLVGIVNPLPVLKGREKGVRDGTYTVPVTLWNASKDEPSMGNSAMMQTGKLVVKDGEGQLYLRFTQMTFSGMTGYLSALDLLEDISYNKYNYPDTYTLIPATVHSSYDVVDDFNGSQSTDINCAGKMYPHVLSVPVSLEQENIWAHVYVPVMGSLGFGDQLCRIHLDIQNMTGISEEDEKLWDEYEGKKELPVSTPGNTSEPDVTKTPADTPEPTASPTQVPTPVPVDKTELGTLIGQAEQLLTQTDKYTEASLNQLKGTLDQAKKAFESSTTQVVVDGQTELLKNAISSLVEKSSEQLDKDNLKDGKYHVYVYLWNASSDKASMGDPALNHEALLTVKDGAYQLDLSTHTMTVGTITACLQTLQIKQADGSYVQAEIRARNNPDSQPSVFRFMLPSKEEYIDVLIDPKVEVMGKDPLPARLKISWDTLKKAADDETVKEDTTNVSTSTVSPAVDMTDSTTKIKIQAAANVIPAETKISVRQCRSGNIYKNARSVLSDAKALRVYEIQASAGGKSVSPSGMVTISIPVPSNYKASAIEVYRLNGKSRTRMSGSYKNGYYTFSSNQFGVYAISCTSLKGTSQSSASDTSEDSGTSAATSDNSGSATDTSSRQYAVESGEAQEDEVPENEAQKDEKQNVQNNLEENAGRENEDADREEEMSGPDAMSALHMQNILTIALVVCSVFVSGILAAVTIFVLFGKSGARRNGHMEVRVNEEK